jgi:uncharacterized protein YjbI with pentapeptide repeats
LEQADLERLLATKDCGDCYLSGADFREASLVRANFRRIVTDRGNPHRCGYDGRDLLPDDNAGRHDQ